MLRCLIWMKSCESFCDSMPLMNLVRNTVSKMYFWSISKPKMREKINKWINFQTNLRIFQPGMPREVLNSTWKWYMVIFLSFRSYIILKILFSCQNYIWVCNIESIMNYWRLTRCIYAIIITLFRIFIHNS